MNFFKKDRSQPLYYKRLLIRPDVQKPWQWYGPIVSITALHQKKDMLRFKKIAWNACMQYELNFCRHMITVQTSKEEAFDLVDLNDIESIIGDM